MSDLPGQIFHGSIGENNFVCDPLDTMLFLTVMSEICRKHQRHRERNVYYEPSPFQCENVWVRRENKKKLSSIHRGLYTVLHASEHSMSNLID